MALQNIGASNRDDAFYRYKMPKMITKIEVRGNGTRTNAINMVDIAKALARPTVYTTKYFSCELGAQSKFDGGSQMILLHALKSFCGKESTEAVKEVALVLKELYDYDVLVEEYILQWYDIGKARLTATRVHKSGKMFNPSLNGLKILSLNLRKNK